MDTEHGRRSIAVADRVGGVVAGDAAVLPARVLVYIGIGVAGNSVGTGVAGDCLVCGLGGAANAERRS